MSFPNAIGILIRFSDKVDIMHQHHGAITVNKNENSCSCIPLFGITKTNNSCLFIKLTHHILHNYS